MAGAVMTSIVLKSGVTLMDIVSTRMLGQFGFLGKVSAPAACPRPRPQMQGRMLLPADVIVWGCLAAGAETASTAAMLHLAYMLASMPARAGRRKAWQPGFPSDKSKVAAEFGLCMAACGLSMHFNLAQVVPLSCVSALTSARRAQMSSKAVHGVPVNADPPTASLLATHFGCHTLDAQADISALPSQVFDIFRANEISVDVVATSEISISLTLDPR